MFSPAKYWLIAKNAIFKAYAKDPGKMLLHTGAIGWILSSAAQVTALAFNKKLSPEQKMFLIPQEINDAAVNILSFYTLTYGIKYIGKKLTQSCKYCTKELAEALKLKGYVLEKGQKRVPGKIYAGDWNFDVQKLPEYKTEFEPLYKPFNNGAEVITGLTGSIISSNFVTPKIRNYYAAKRQKEMIAQYHSKKPSVEQTEERPRINDISFDNFRNHAYSSTYYPSGSLKI